MGIKEASLKDDWAELIIDDAMAKKNEDKTDGRVSINDGMTTEFLLNKTFAIPYKAIRTILRKEI
jgi:hypothetical protein